MEKQPNVYLLMIGKGDLQEQIRHQVQNLGLSDRTCMLSGRGDIPRLMKAMDVFVMPSLYEGLPFTAVEAQVNGLKCVLSDEITKTANASGDVVYLPLAAEKALWADVIAKQAEKRSDAQNTEKVILNYDIHKEAQKLQRIYTEIV